MTGGETSAKWRDVMINGRFRTAPGGNQHIVEIQFHHTTLLFIRKSLGGHFLYARLRSLLEASEVIFGPEETSKSLERHRLLQSNAQ